MEEIEYLEEYEDLILPTIKSSTNAPKYPNTMASVPDDEDSSSIDQDIFESLFDDHSDDDSVPQKKVNPKFNQRPDERASMDSIDLLVKDLGEPPQGARPRAEHSSADNVNRVVQKATPKERSSNAKSGTIASTAKADSSTRPDKPKSVATVRPTVQSRSQEKRASSAVSGSSAVQKAGTDTRKVSMAFQRITTGSHAVSSTQNTRVLSVASSMSKTGSSGLFALSSRKQISVATSTTNTSEIMRTGPVADVCKKPSRSQPTIIKPEKPQSRDPVEDPLCLDNINHVSDSDSLSLSDISADSFVSLSDEDGRNIIELSNDSSLERANLDKIRGATPSPIVSEDNKSDKGESPGKLLLQVVATAETTSKSITPTSNEDVHIEDNVVDHEEIIGRCISPSASNCVGITELPEKAIVVSDTLLPRCDSVPLRATVSQDESKVTSSGKQSDDETGELEGSAQAALSKSIASTIEQEKLKHTSKTGAASNAECSSELSESKKPFGNSVTGLALNNKKESDDGVESADQPKETDKKSENKIEESRSVKSLVQIETDTNEKLSKTGLLKAEHYEKELIGNIGNILDNISTTLHNISGDASVWKDKEAKKMLGDTVRRNELVKRKKSIETSGEEKPLVNASCMAKESNWKKNVSNNQEIKDQVTQDLKKDNANGNGKQDTSKDNTKKTIESQPTHESLYKNTIQDSSQVQEVQKSEGFSKGKEGDKKVLHSDHEANSGDVCMDAHAMNVIEKESIEDSATNKIDNNKTLDTAKNNDKPSKDLVSERLIFTGKHTEDNQEEKQSVKRGSKNIEKGCEKSYVVRIPSEDIQQPDVSTVVRKVLEHLEKEETTSKEGIIEDSYKSSSSSQVGLQNKRTKDKKTDAKNNTTLDDSKKLFYQNIQKIKEQKVDKSVPKGNHCDADAQNKNIQSCRRMKKKKGNKDCNEENESTKDTAECPLTPNEITEHKNVSQGSTEGAADSELSSVKASGRSATALVNSINQVESKNFPHIPEQELRRRSLRKRGAEQSSFNNDVNRKMLKQPLNSGTMKPKEPATSALSPKRSIRSPLTDQKHGKDEPTQTDKSKTELKRKTVVRLPCDNMEKLTNSSKNESEAMNAKKRCKIDVAEDYDNSFANVSTNQKSCAEGIAEIASRLKNPPQKSEQFILKSKLEHVAEKKMSPKVEKAKFCEDPSKMVTVKDKEDITLLSHGSKRKLPQHKEKPIPAAEGSPLKSKRDKTETCEPPKKLYRQDLETKVPQKPTERKKRETTSENGKSRLVLSNSRNKKVYTLPEDSTRKCALAHALENDPLREQVSAKTGALLKNVKKCLDVECEATLHLTPEKRTQRLKAIDERYPSNLGTERAVENQVAPNKVLLETQRKSLRAKGAYAEKETTAKQNEDNSLPTQNFNEKFNATEDNQELEECIENDAKKETQSSEVKTKSSQSNKDALPTKKTKLSPKKSPGSTVITFKEWLNQRQFEEVEKSLEQMHEEHANEQYKSLEKDNAKETNKEVNKRSTNKVILSKNKASTTCMETPVSADHIQYSSKRKNRVKKSEAEMLKDQMPKEMKDGGIALLLEEKTPRRMLKSGFSKAVPHITSPLTVGGKGELPTTLSKEFKVPPAPQRSRGTPMHLVPTNSTVADSSNTNGEDKAENRNKLHKNFKLRKLRIRLSRASVTAYFRNLATQNIIHREADASSLESSTVPELGGTLSSAESNTPSNAVSTEQSAVIGKSAVTLTQKRVILRAKPPILTINAHQAITGSTNVLSIPKDQRRVPPLLTKSSTVATRDGSSVDTSAPECCLLTPLKSVANTLEAPVRKQQPLHQEERQQPDQPTAENGNISQSNMSVANDLTSTAQFTPVEPKEEIVDEAPTIATTPVGANTSTTRTLGSIVVSQSALSAAGTTFGVAPTIIDSNGTRLYSFLHPAKYQRSHGCVLLDYCCPNLDGPMPAIDPTRIHTQVQAAVRELPAYIVMTTKLITRADLEANKNVIPASIRQKVEKITANAVGASSTTGTVVPALPVPAQPAPLTTPTISALQKQLPPTTTITPKILPSNLAGTATVANEIALPPLTPFSAISNSHSIVPPSPILLEYQRSLLRSHLRQFDACLKKHYSRIGMLTFAKRQQMIEGVVSTTALSAKDVEIAVRLLEEYAAQISSTATPMVSAGSQQQRPAQCNATLKPKATTARTPVATATQQQQHPLQQQLKHQVPIYDVHKNVIGYQFQMTAPSTGITVTKSVMSARSEVMSTSTNAKRASVSNVYATTTPTSTLKSITQESPRIFYAKPPLQTSTPITSSAGTTPMGSSITLRSTPRLNREITIRRVSPPNVSSTITSSVVRMPTLTRNPHLSAAITSAQRTSTSVTTQSSVTLAPSPKRITRKTAAAAAAKVIVVTQGHCQNNQSTTDECILPDDNDSPQIKHEKFDDDFISAN